MNIQTILDKLTDDLTHYTKVVNTIPAYQGIQEFDKVWNGVKDSLTSMLDGIKQEVNSDYNQLHHKGMVECLNEFLDNLK